MDNNTNNKYPDNKQTTVIDDSVEQIVDTAIASSNFEEQVNLLTQAITISQPMNEDNE